MRVVDLIEKKREGQALTKAELTYLIQGYAAGQVPDYQMSAFAMAVCFQGMTDEEITALTLAMAESGEQLDLSSIPGVKVDKHSTGGVGDTTTLILGPLVASVGVPVAKMSGRGLGHTGGTIDKLESIPGFETSLDTDTFLEQVKEVGIAVAGQTHDLAPADKSLYALRDVTATVSSTPLIASSIMSKKLASGANAIVLDVKVGDGAFMKDVEHASELASKMVRIGALSGRRVTALLTQMEEPLGRAVGNALEVREAIQTLRGQGPSDLTELCLRLGSEMVVLAGKANTVEEARTLLEENLQNGKALDTFRQFVKAQHGDPRVADDMTLLPSATVVRTYHAPQDGYVCRLHAEPIGLVAMRLGAGRAERDDIIDNAVGLVLLRKVGDRVLAGEPMVEVHAKSEADASEAIQSLAKCIELSDTPISPLTLILGRVSERGEVVMEGETRAQQARSAHQTKSVAHSRETSSATTPNPEASSGEDLVKHARQARESAYVPYSQFQVGAALRLSNGDIIHGANVENASYGLTNCAERTALFKFVTSEAYRNGLQVVEVAVVADSDVPVAPCGACRQVLAEFCDAGTPVTLGNMKGETRQTTVEGLLPYAFDASQMEP